MDYAFLCDRRQRLEEESKSTGWTEVCNGIPQGSLRGPMLFLILIIYLSDAVESCTNFNACRGFIRIRERQSPLSDARRSFL